MNPNIKPFYDRWRNAFASLEAELDRARSLTTFEDRIKACYTASKLYYDYLTADLDLRAAIHAESGWQGPAPILDRKPGSLEAAIEELLKEQQ